MITFNNITSDYMGLKATVLDFNIIPPIREVVRTMPYQNISYVELRKYAPRPIKIELSFTATDKLNYFEGLKTINAWLVTAEEKKLILNDYNPNVYFKAIVKDTESINKLGLDGQSVITFMCYNQTIYNVDDDSVNWNPNSYL